MRGAGRRARREQRVDALLGLRQARPVVVDGDFHFAGLARGIVSQGGFKSDNRPLLQVQHLVAKGYIARGGQIIDATIVPVPKQRNTREENEAIKGGETPKAWKKKPAKNRQKDKDARWTKKHGRSFYGYKNHVNADATHKLIRRYDVSDAAVHDSQKLDALLNKANTCADVFADSAYRSAEAEARLKARGFRSRIHVRATRNHPLSQQQEEANRKKSQIRVRIEHVFGAQETSTGSRLVRTVGIVRARAKIGLQNLVYNIRRFVTLDRMATV